jgi:hypothetical protein
MVLRIATGQTERVQIVEGHGAVLRVDDQIVNAGAVAARARQTRARNI